MLSYLAGLEEYFGPFRLFASITLRTMLAAVTAMLLGFAFGPRLIRSFRRLKLGHGYVDERTADLGPGYFDKKNTPTMGGLIIFLSVFGSSVLWAAPNIWVIVSLFVYAALTIPGFRDDYLKVVRKSRDGVSSWEKIIWQTLITVFALFEGDRQLPCEVYQYGDLMRTAQMVRLKYEAGYRVIAIDDTGVGGGVTDRLREMGVPCLIHQPVYNMLERWVEHGLTNVLSAEGIGCIPFCPLAQGLLTDRYLAGIPNDARAAKPHGFLKGDYLTSAAQAKFFGAPISETFLGSDKAIVKIVTVLLIAFMSGTTFTTQRQLMVKGMPKMDSSNNMMLQQQKIMLYVFPIIFAISGVNFPVGVLLYWGTTNLWTFGQQMYVIKRNPTPGSPAYDEWRKKQEAKNKSDVTPTESNEGSVATEEPKGQRKQPKRKRRNK